MSETQIFDMNPPYGEAEYRERGLVPPPPDPVATALLLACPDRQLCNCRRAFYDDRGRCANGCSANCYDATDILAQFLVDRLLPTESSE